MTTKREAKKAVWTEKRKAEYNAYVDEQASKGAAAAPRERWLQLQHGKVKGG